MGSNVYLATPLPLVGNYLFSDCQPVLTFYYQIVRTYLRLDLFLTLNLCLSAAVIVVLNVFDIK